VVDYASRLLLGRGEYLANDSRESAVAWAFYVRFHIVLFTSGLLLLSSVEFEFTPRPYSRRGIVASI
jgi:hypothetical protein